MSTLGQTSQMLESYVPVYDMVPEKWEDARAFLVEQLKKISNQLNATEIGWFLDEELVSGKNFFPGVNSADDQQFRTILRKVVDMGPLPVGNFPATGINAKPHGITVDANFSLISMFGGATDPTNLDAVPLPYPTDFFNEIIQIWMDATNVYIYTNSDWSSYTRSYIVLEYIQEL